ncbi:transcriptional regulator, ArgR family [Acetitomaculum ruminis DSM 5522]|uniref:Arginine repressor n=1 Tax=Acetitomaculum ruminis DSM 5522 TaxID=1120918 RepID=A0A1I0VU08_9FIRM|nr:arginine repressor [Acetitomaculum ruminis]SFA79400.1 transcriptional regulator, ArgR family [Acetitomaculum ruminis DSM 5522]
MKQDRHNKIIELITEHDIETQEELASLLNEAGFSVTQATVSRDIRELKLSKASPDGIRQKYVFLSNNLPNLGEKYSRALKDGFVSITQASNMIVVKTFPGMAMAVAAAIDALNIAEIAGCIAGDDTIMCATKGREEAALAIEKIQNITSV